MCSVASDWTSCSDASKQFKDSNPWQWLMKLTSTGAVGPDIISFQSSRIQVHCCLTSMIEQKLFEESGLTVLTRNPKFLHFCFFVQKSEKPLDVPFLLFEVATRLFYSRHKSCRKIFLDFCLEGLSKVLMFFAALLESGSSVVLNL